MKIKNLISVLIMMLTFSCSSAFIRGYERGEKRVNDFVKEVTWNYYNVNNYNKYGYFVEPNGTIWKPYERNLNINYENFYIYQTYNGYVLSKYNYGTYFVENNTPYTLILWKNPYNQKVYKNPKYEIYGGINIRILGDR